jgi:hypothetical protein
MSRDLNRTIGGGELTQSSSLVFTGSRRMIEIKKF